MKDALKLAALQTLAIGAFPRACACCAVTSEHMDSPRR